MRKYPQSEVKRCESNLFFAGENPPDSPYSVRNEELKLYYEHLPYMGKSVWYFSTEKRQRTGSQENRGERTRSQATDLNSLINQHDQYRIKVLITGMYGRSPYAAVKVYERSDLINGEYVEVEDEPDGSIEFDTKFHEVQPF
jgi:hypothetical protein